MRLWISLLSLTLLGCAAAQPGPLADASGDTPVEEVRSSVSSDSELVCTMGRATGSHIAGRRCVTRAEQERITEASQEWMRTGGAQGSPYIVPDAADPRTDERDGE